MGGQLTYRERYAQLHEVEDKRKELVEVRCRSRDWIALHFQADERGRIFLMKSMKSERA